MSISAVLQQVVEHWLALGDLALQLADFAQTVAFQLQHIAVDNFRELLRYFRLFLKTVPKGRHLWLRRLQQLITMFHRCLSYVEIGLDWLNLIFADCALSHVLDEELEGCNFTVSFSFLLLQVENSLFEILLVILVLAPSFLDFFELCFGLHQLCHDLRNLIF